MLDNIQVAILTKVNQLAERFGVKPYEFVATVHASADAPMSLRFEIPVSGGKRRHFDAMLDLIGLDANAHVLSGSDAEIVDALDEALRVAPKRRSR